MDVLCWILVGALGVSTIPGLTSVMVEGAWRSRWRVDGSREAEVAVPDQGMFREATIHATLPSLERDRAPGWVRAAAFSCWLLGQMVIPGFLVWCVGLLMLSSLNRNGDPSGLVMMASFFPGAWCAWLLWTAGCALVRGEREAADRATRRAATVIVGYNLVTSAAALLWFSAHPRDEFLVGCAAYGLVSIVHVVAVRAIFLSHRAEFPAAE